MQSEFLALLITVGPEITPLQTSFLFILRLTQRLEVSTGSSPFHFLQSEPLTSLSPTAPFKDLLASPLYPPNTKGAVIPPCHFRRQLGHSLGTHLLNDPFRDSRKPLPILPPISDGGCFPEARMCLGHFLNEEYICVCAHTHV